MSLIGMHLDRKMVYLWIEVDDSKIFTRRSIVMNIS